MGGNVCPCLALNRQLPGGLLPLGVPRAGGAGGHVSTWCLCPGSCLRRCPGAGVRFGPEETDAGAARAGLGRRTPHPARGPAPPGVADSHALASGGAAACSPPAEPVLRVTLQCEGGSADQQALGTLLEARGVRGQEPWFLTGSRCRAPSVEVLLTGDPGLSTPQPWNPGKLLSNHVLSRLSGCVASLVAPDPSETAGRDGVTRGLCHVETVSTDASVRGEGARPRGAGVTRGVVMLGDAADTRVCGCLGSTVGERGPALSPDLSSQASRLWAWMGGWQGRLPPRGGTLEQRAERGGSRGSPGRSGGCTLSRGQRGPGSPCHGPLGAVTTPDLMEGRGAVGKGWGQLCCRWNDLCDSR